MKAIIFGASGQDGYYLEEILRQNKIETLGISRSHSDFKGDVANRSFVNAVIRDQKPAYIFHLAANSTTAHHAIFDNHEAISTGTFNILEALKDHAPACKVFLSGSAMQFRNNGQPINEQTPFEASSPYSVSRIQSVYAGRYFREKFGLKIYAGYFFNHDSPLRTEKHVNQKIVKAVQRIKNNPAEKLELGNIDVKKEFNFAADIMQAVWLLVNQSETFETVIGSGKAYSLKDWLIYCFNKIGKNWQDHLLIKSDFTPEYQILVSDPTLIKRLGWQPSLDIYQLADLMMDN